VEGHPDAHHARDPCSGSANALNFLANGFRKGWGPFTVDLTDTLRSYTSVYQPVPSYRCLRGPEDSWLNLDEVDWTRTGVDGDRLADAIKTASRPQENGRRPPGHRSSALRGPSRHRRFPAHTVGRNPDGTNVVPQSMRALGEEGGDGTVAKISASPHELLEGFQQAAFVSQKHASLQNDNPVIDHIGGLVESKTLTPVHIGDVETLEYR
jgi:hypothetical protein